VRGSPPPACFWLEHLPGEWGIRVVGSPHGNLEKPLGPRRGAVWQAHTVCTYNKSFSFDGLRWFVRVTWTAQEEPKGGLGRGR
jgi:hypothetical protein